MANVTPINPNGYENKALFELRQWQKEMQEPPSALGEGLKELQARFNRIIPQKVHHLIASAIKQMTKTVITGAGITTTVPNLQESLEAREEAVEKRIKFYQSSAAIEGGVTGYGGFMMGLADLPLWLSLKMKMLFEVAACYGYDIEDRKERVFILDIFQVTFSSQKHRNKIYAGMADWANRRQLLADNLESLDWNSYWVEYRDSLDLAKLFQLIPGVGALVGSTVNYRLTKKLGQYAMNAYRMRMEQDGRLG